MKLIAHRGYFRGPEMEQNSFKPLENTLDQVDKAILAGFDVEIDLNYKYLPNSGNKQLYLFHAGSGSDPAPVDLHWIRERENHLWVHAKDGESLSIANEQGWNCFFHGEAEYTMTSKGYIWAHPKSKYIKNSIVAVPESDQNRIHVSITESIIEAYWRTFNGAGIIGICSDYVMFYRDLQDKNVPV